MSALATVISVLFAVSRAPLFVSVATGAAGGRVAKYNAQLELPCEASVSPMNPLFLRSDPHARNALGCCGHPPARIPSLDALAAGPDIREGAAPVRAQGDFADEWACTPPPGLPLTGTLR